jgi:hypothetical protein
MERFQSLESREMKATESYSFHSYQSEVTEFRKKEVVVMVENPTTQIQQLVHSPLTLSIEKATVNQ